MTRILIVDDEKSNTFLIQQLLEEEHYETLTASDAFAGLDIARKESPDLILLDIRMPGMDGLAMLTELKASVLTEKIPVIFLTALDHSRDVVKGLHMGADEYITKPFGDGQELIARIGTVLRIRASEERAMRLAHLLQGLQGVAVAINQGLDLIHTLETVVNFTVSLGEFDWAAVVLDDHAQLTRTHFSKGLQAGTQVVLSGDTLRRTLDVEKTIIVRNVSLRKDEPHSILLACGVGAYVGIPMRNEDTTLGILYALCGRAAIFSDEQIRAIEGIAMHAAIAINNARLYERIKGLEATKTLMISMASHDLRNPLTIALNSLSMLGDDLRGRHALQSYEDQLFQLAERGLAQMETLIEDILSAGRIDEMFERGPELLNIRDLMQTVWQTQQLQATANHQRLTLVADDDLPLVRGYMQPLRESIANLVANALKYTPKDGTIQLSAHTVQNEVQIEVQDNGLGIPEDRQGRLFEPFYRARQPGTEKISGSGLGLSMVKKVAEQHGGRVWFRSTPDVGSTFGMALPIAETPPTNTRDKHSLTTSVFTPSALPPNENPPQMDFPRSP